MDFSREMMACQDLRHNNMGRAVTKVTGCYSDRPLMHPGVISTADDAARAGESYMQRTAEASPHRDQGLSRIIIHDNHDGHSDTHNFAPTWAMNLAPNVETVHLPEQNTIPDETHRYYGDRSDGYSGTMMHIEHRVSEGNHCDYVVDASGSGRTTGESFIHADRGAPNCKGYIDSPSFCHEVEDSDMDVEVGSSSWDVGNVDDREHTPIESPFYAGRGVLHCERFINSSFDRRELENPDRDVEVGSILWDAGNVVEHEHTTYESPVHAGRSVPNCDRFINSPSDRRELEDSDLDVEVGSSSWDVGNVDDREQTNIESPFHAGRSVPNRDRFINSPSERRQSEDSDLDVEVGSIFWEAGNVDEREHTTIESPFHAGRGVPHCERFINSPFDRRELQNSDRDVEAGSTSWDAGNVDEREHTTYESPFHVGRGVPHCERFINSPFDRRELQNSDRDVEAGSTSWDAGNVDERQHTTIESPFHAGRGVPNCKGCAERPFLRRELQNSDRDVEIGSISWDAGNVVEHEHTTDESPIHVGRGVPHCERFIDGPFVHREPVNSVRFIEVGTTPWDAGYVHEYIPHQIAINIPSAPLWINRRLEYSGYDAPLYILTHETF